MDRIRNIINLLPKPLRNKYLILLLLFIFWIVFLDENNLVSLNNQLNENIIKKEIIDSLEYGNWEIEDKLKRLNNDQKELEKFARENFLMKKENEDIIIIREKGDE